MNIVEGTVAHHLSSPMPRLAFLAALVLLLAAPDAHAQCFDEFEPNDSFGQAIALPFDWPNESIVCDATDEDHFVITLTQGQQIAAQISNNLFDATIEVFDTNQQPVGQAVSTAGFAEVVHTALAAGNYYVRISGTSGNSQNPYEVTVLDQGGGPTPTPAPSPTPTPRFPGCPDGFEPNDVIGGPGFDAVGGPLVSYICAAADVDYFQIAGVVANQTIKLELQSVPKDYDLTLYRPDFSQAAYADSSGQSNETIVFNANVGGTWHAKVTGKGQSDATRPYTINARLYSCSLDAHEQNQDAAQSTSLGHPTTTKTEPNLTVCPPGDEDWFSLDVTAAERIIADVTHDPAQGPVRLCLVDPDTSTQWRCTNGILATERIDYIVPTNGRWYLSASAQTVGGTNPGYSISAVVQPPPPTPTPCLADANEQNASPGTSTRTGVCPTAGCNDVYSASNLSICSGDEDWFDLTASAGDVVEVRLDFVHLDGDIDMTLYDLNLNPVASATSTHDDEYLFTNVATDNTALFLKVFAKGGGSGNRDYDIEVKRIPPPPPPTPSPSPAPTPSPTPIVCAPSDTLLDLKLQEMEITQSIQDLNQNMPLVARKTTYARLYVTGDRDIFLPRPVTGYLRGQAFDGTPLVPASAPCHGYLQNVGRHGTAIAKLRGQHPRLGLSCRVPGTWAVPRAAPILITAHVDTPSGYCDQSGGNDETSAYAEFEPELPLFVQAVQVREGSCNQASCGPSWWSYRKIHLLAERMWPASRIRLIPDRGDSIPWKGEEGTANEAYGKSHTYGSRNPKLPGQTALNTVVAGMVKPWTGVGARGFAKGHGFWVSTDRPDTFAHEFGHAAGSLEHVPGCMSGNGNGNGGLENYPYDTTKLSNLHPRSYWGLDTGGTAKFPTQINPNLYADMLTYCTPNRWASDYTYRKFGNYQAGASSFPTPTPSAPSPRSAAGPATYVRLIGVIDTRTDAVVLSPLTFTDDPFAPDRDGLLDQEYRAVLLDAADTILAETTFRLEVLQDSLSTDAGFAVYLPADPSMGAVALSRDGVEIYRRTASPNPPAITVSPVAGTVADLLTLSWVASDADGDSVSFDIDLSSDGGETWRPLTAFLDATSTELDTSFWGGTNDGLLRVTASDGFHRTSQTAGPFAVPYKDPVVGVLVPEDGVEVNLGEPLHLRAAAFDPEEMFPDDDAFSWFSDVDGALGTGEQLVVEDLTPGWHELTVEVTDGDGGTSAESVFICASDLQCDSDPSECPTSGFAPDTDGDGVCDRIDVCPDAADPGQGDGDDDGTGDACDPCTGGATHRSAKVRITGLSEEEGADGLRYNATLEFPEARDLALRDTGLALQIRDARGVDVVDLVLPPGTRDGEFGGELGGWFQNRDGTRQRYATGSASDGPRVSATVRSYRHRPGVLKVTVRARGAAFPTADMELPLRAYVTFTPGVGATGECADAVFGEELDGCRPSADGRRVVCG